MTAKLYTILGEGDYETAVLGFRSRCGRLAVHQITPGDRTSDWSIDHLPTGYRITRRATRAEALAVRRALEALGNRWDFTDPKAANGELGDLCKARLDAHGLTEPDWRKRGTF